jgi:hypothetical protein
MGKLGSTILKEIMAAPASSRDKMILDLLSARNIPSWSFEWRPIRVTASIDGKPYTLEYLVAPDYLSLGVDDDFFRIPLTPKVAQAFADEMDAILPSRRMVNEIYANAPGKLQPQSIAGNKATLEDWAKHEILVQQQMKAHGLPGGTFLAGHKKDIVVGPGLDGSRVAIYGWHDESGALTGGKANAPIQPYSTIHDSAYTDYAHGTRLVRQKGYLNGEAVDLRELFVDPKLSILVSDQGPFKPRYPFTAGGGGIEQAAFVRTDTSQTSRLAAQAVDAFSKGDDVRAAQTVLVALGYDLGAAGADGVLGPKTSAALKKFLASEGITQTGTLDDVTKKRLQTRAQNLKPGFFQRTEVKVGGALVAALGLGFLAKKAFFS